MRIEKDSLGSKEVPQDALYGIHTTRSLENFKIGGEPFPLDLIYAMARLKKAAARANCELDLISEEKSEAISRAADLVLSGKHDDQFPIDLFQAGSGTSSNMNTNEVMANLACIELGGKPGDRNLVHPNDDVNMGQSTNNLVPSAIRIASFELSDKMLAAARELVEELEKKAREFSDCRKSARTHLQDAVPITLGQEFSAYARALEKDSQRIEWARDQLKELGVGGNAVGTGLNTKPDFRSGVIRNLNRDMQSDWRVADNGVEITQFLSDQAALASALRGFALDLQKISNDLRLLSSGPNTAIGEINLPPVEPGSSIMPGKVNPSICEAVNMACMQILGYDCAISAAAGAGQMELNTHMPLLGANLVKSLKIARRISLSLARQCVSGITANREVCRYNFEHSAGLATVLNPLLGYDRVSELVKRSVSSHKTLRALVEEEGLIDPEELAEIINGSCGPRP